jgi:hypothetical protein
MTSKIMKCNGCGKEVRVPRNRFKTFRFCSKDCQTHGLQKKVSLVCIVCAKPFKVIYHRKNKAKYCSRQCYYQGQKGTGSIEKVCQICGTTYRTSPSKTHGKRFCSAECRGISQRKREHAWPTSARRRVMKDRPHACELCGYSDHPEILVVHHVNGRINHRMDNLQLLCPNCHAIVHFGK